MTKEEWKKVIEEKLMEFLKELVNKYEKQPTNYISNRRR